MSSRLSAPAAITAPLLASVIVLTSVGRPAVAAPPQEPVAIASGISPVARGKIVLLARLQTEAAVLAAAVAAHLSDLPVDLVTVACAAPPDDVAGYAKAAQKAARGGDVLAVFWLQARGQDTVFIYLPEGDGGRLFVREVPQVDSGGSEGVAVVVRQVVRAVMAGVQMGTPWDATPDERKSGTPVDDASAPSAQAATSAAPVGDGHPTGLAAVLSMGIAAYAPGRWQWQTGAGLRLSPVERVLVGLLYRYGGEVQTEQAFARVRSSSHHLGLGAGLLWPVGDAIELSADLTVSVGRGSYSAAAAQAGVVPEPARTVTLWSLTPALGVGYALGKHVSVGFAARCEWFPRSVELLVRTGESTVAVPSMYYLQPGLQITASWQPF